MIVVQIVRILWTKATRGAPRANERAALPRAFVFEVEEAPYLITRYEMSESHGFEPVLARRATAPAAPRREGMLRIEVADGGLILGLEHGSGDGQPWRPEKTRAAVLAQGESARLMHNARHASYSGQYYTETIYNVAFGPSIASDAFLRSAPTHEFDMKDHLF